MATLDGDGSLEETHANRARELLGSFLGVSLHEILSHILHRVMMRVIIRREAGFEHNHYCLLEFMGKFEGQESSRSLVNIGTLQEVPSSQKGKTMYRIEMGTIDIVGTLDEKFDEHFLHTEATQVSEGEKILVVKGVVTKKIVFNKRPSPNLERLGEGQCQEGYSMFRGKK